MKGTTSRTRKPNTQELVARLALIVGTLVLMIFATVIVAKICYSQYRMFAYYVQIQRAEDSRDYNEDLSRSYFGPYSDFASSYDEEVAILTKERMDYCAGVSDSITKWSIRDGFDLLTAIIGVIGFSFAVLLWINLFRFLPSIIDTEFWLLQLVFCKLTGRKCRKCYYRNRCRKSTTKRRVG